MAVFRQMKGIFKMVDRTLVKEHCINNFLLKFEGTGPMDKQGNFHAYVDAVGVVTIAWGITTDESNKPIKLGAIWSEDRARKRKEAILDDFLNRLLHASPMLEKQPVRRVAAVLSWVYNLGIGNYLKSTFKKKIDSGAWGDAYIECKKWDKAGGKVLKGLTRRREAEAVLIANP